MNWLKKAGMLAMIGASLGLAGCATSTSSDTYSRGSVGDVNHAERGHVVSARPVKIEGTRSGIGTATGAVIGGAAGSQVGGGRAENIIVGVAGAVAGGLIGAAVEENVTESTGYEYVVKLEDGHTVTIVQGDSNPIQPGTSVMLVYGERARIVPAY